METHLCIIGMGYVGLPLALQFADQGIRVTGLDVDPAKVGTLNNGQSYLSHIPPARIQSALQKGPFQASSDFSRIRSATAVIICVPTPLSKNREPDLSFVLNSGRALAPHLARGALVVLESTTYPGTTEDELLPILESGSGLKAGIDFHLAFSPEREDPGNPDSHVAKVPKVIGGLTPACLAAAESVYGRIVQELVPVSSCRVAEATKLLENIFRSVNIALVNELKVIYAEMGIDIWEVIAAAKTKPFGFMPFYPGPGLGGHCIPIDPFYLTWKAREFGQHTRFIELAGEINTAMPAYVFGRLVHGLNDFCKCVKGSRILVLGLAYKAETNDTRESPAFALLNLIKEHGGEASYYDPYVPCIPPTREHSNWAGLASVDWHEEAIRSFDAVIIATAHRNVSYDQLKAWSKLIIDTRNIVSPGPSGATVIRA